MRDTTTAEQARAVFLAAIVVVSMVGIGFAGTAAANATALTGQSATDVAVDQDSVTQEVTFDVTLGANTNDTVTINTSEARAEGATISDASLSTVSTETGLNVTDVTVNGDDNVDVSIEDDSSSEASGTVSIHIQHDTQGLTDTDGSQDVTYDLSDSDDSISSTVSFGTDQQGIVAGGSPEDVGSSQQTQTINNTRVFVGDVSGDSVFVHYEISDLVNQGVDVDSVSGFAPSSFELVDGSGEFTSSETTKLVDNDGNYVATLEVANTGSDYVEFNTTTAGTFDASNADSATGLNYSVAASFGQIDSNLDGNDGAPTDSPYTNDFELIDQGPSIESVDIAETPVNVSNNNGQERDITVTFSESVENVVVNVSGIPTDEGTYSLNGLPGTATNDTWTHTWNSPTVASGVDTNGTISVEADDDNSDESVSTEEDIVLDTQPPNVTANTSDTISGDSYDITTEFELQNTGDADLTYEYDAGNGYEEIASPGDFNTSNVSDGDINLRATAVDDAGNEDSDTGSTVIDNNAPTVSTNLTNNEVLTGTVDLSTRFTAENVDGNEVSYFVDEGADGNFSSVSASFDTDTVADGSAVLKANASDDAGTEASASQDVVVDNTVPDNLTIDSPSEPTFVNAGEIQFNYSYTEVNPDEEQIVFSADGEETVYFNFTNVGGGEDIERNRTLDLTSPDSGNITNATYNVSVEATDVTGEQSDSTTETDLVTVDDVAPGEINIVEPSAEQIVESDDILTVAYNYDEENTESVTVTLDGPEERTYDIDDSQYQNNGIRKTVNLDLDEEGDLQDGSYDVTVEVTDSAGNDNSSTTDEAYVVVNDEDPTAEGVSLDPAEDVAPDASVNVTYDFSDSVNASAVEIRVWNTNETGVVTGDYVEYNFDSLDEAPGENTKTIDLANPDDASGDFEVTDNDDYLVTVVVTDETGKDNDFTLESGGPAVGQSASLDVNENAPTVTDVQADAGTDTVTVEFSETLGNDDVDVTDFAYQDVSNSSATEVVDAELNDDDMSVELELDSAVEADELGNDTISVTQNSLYDTHPQDERYVSSGDDYALEDDEVAGFDVEVDGVVANANVENYGVTVDGDENLDFEVEAVGPNGTTVTQNDSVAAGGSSTANLNLSELVDGDVEMTVTVTDEANNSDSSPTLTRLKDTDGPDIDAFEGDAGTDSVYVTFDQSVNYPTDGEFTLNGIDANVYDVQSADDTNQYELELTDDVSSSAFDADDPANVTADGVTDTNGNAFDGEAVNISDRSDPFVTDAGSSNGSDTVSVDFSESVYNGSDGALSADNFTYVNNTGVSHTIESVEHTAGSTDATVTLDSALTPEDVNSDEIEVTVNDTVDKQTTTSAVIEETVDISEFDLSDTTETNASEIQVSFTADEELDTFGVDLFASSDIPEFEADNGVVELNESDFDVTEQDDGTYDYSYNYTVPRDGEYVAILTDATSVGGSPATDSLGDVVSVDYDDPEPVDAEIVDAGDSSTTVAVQFSEPVVPDSDADIQNITVDGESATGVAPADEPGEWAFTFDSVIATGDGQNIAFGEETVVELHGDATSAAGTSETVDTHEFHIAEGSNFVSVPAEFGSLDIADSEFSDMSVMTYENGEWVSYAPDKSADNQDLESMEGGQGYVVNADSDATVDVTVRNEESGDSAEDATPGQQQLQEGWNLVGHWQEGTQPAADGPGGALDSVGGDSTATNVYGQDTPGEFDYTPVTDFEPGEAYWVFLEDDEVYTASNYDTYGEE